MVLQFDGWSRYSKLSLMVKLLTLSCGRIHKTVSKLNCWMQLKVEVIEVPFPSDSGKPKLDTLSMDLQSSIIIKMKRKLLLQNCLGFSGSEKMGSKRCCAYRSSQFVVHLVSCTMTNGWKPSVLGQKYYSPYYNTIDGFAEMRTLWFPMLQSVSNGDEKARTSFKEDLYWKKQTKPLPWKNNQSMNQI